MYRAKTHGWGYSSMVELVLSLCEVLRFNPSTPKLIKKDKNQKSIGRKYRECFCNIAIRVNKMRK
jgi:hypothetical protein